MIDLNENAATAAVDGSIFEDEPNVYNYREILETLMLHRDLILTMEEDQVAPLRQGLSVVKAKYNAKLKDNGIVPSTDTIKYNVYRTPEQLDDKNSTDCTVRLTLGPRAGIVIKKMEIPDDSI